MFVIVTQKGPTAVLIAYCTTVQRKYVGFMHFNYAMATKVIKLSKITVERTLKRKKEQRNYKHLSPLLVVTLSKWKMLFHCSINMIFLLYEHRIITFNAYVGACTEIHCFVAGIMYIATCGKSYLPCLAAFYLHIFGLHWNWCVKHNIWNSSGLVLDLESVRQ